jgi:hypothetical protein
VALVGRRNIPTERQPLIVDVSAKFADRRVSRGRRDRSSTAVISVSRPKPLLFFQAAPQLYSRGWMVPVPDPILVKKCGSVGNRIRYFWICSQELWPLDHRGGLVEVKVEVNFATDSQSASLSWCQAPIWDLWSIFISPWNFLQTYACLLFCSALSDERTGL